MADLRTITGVELIRCGRWQISTGLWTVTPADLRSALAAHASGVMRKPTIRLGHTDPRFDGEPSIGYVDNLRIVDNGRTLIGDLIGVPGWLADVAASAFPDRSVEGLRGFTDHTGARHSFVLTGLALLGVTRPGIPALRSLNSLDDVRELFDVAAAATAGARPVALLIRAAAPTLTARQAARVATARRTRTRRAAAQAAPPDAWSR